MGRACSTRGREGRKIKEDLGIDGDNIKMDLKEIRVRWKIMDWILVA
jgi:hypothetical protein